MPSRPVLLGLLIMAVAPPFVARASGTFVGSSAMFTELERYHVEVAVQTAEGIEPLSLVAMAPHLSRDARKNLLPAAGHAVGASQVGMVAGGLDDLAYLACRLRPDATSAVVRLERDSFDLHKTVETSRRTCGPAR